MNNDKEIKLLGDIKRLLVLQLVKGFKVSFDDIGEVLGVTGRAVRNVATSQKKPHKKNKK